MEDQQGLLLVRLRAAWRRRLDQEGAKPKVDGRGRGDETRAWHCGAARGGKVDLETVVKPHARRSVVSGARGCSPRGSALRPPSPTYVSVVRGPRPGPRAGARLRSVSGVSGLPNCALRVLPDARGAGVAWRVAVGGGSGSPAGAVPVRVPVAAGADRSTVYGPRCRGPAAPRTHRRRHRGDWRSAACCVLVYIFLYSRRTTNYVSVLRDTIRVPPGK